MNEMSEFPYDCEKWEEIDRSSNIKGVGVCGGDLVVEFNNNTAYIYSGLGIYFDDLINADSVGKYFRINIRNESCKKL